MSDRPYTDDDLRAEAARQHATLAEDPHFMGVGERMEDAWVPSVETAEDGSARTWTGLLVTPDETGDDEDYTAFGEAQRTIYDLITGAADVSEWAINLGADGLTPSTEHEITLDAGEQPLARVHFAFSPTMPAEIRTAFVQGLGQAIDDADAALDEPTLDGDCDGDVFELISDIASRLRDATDSGEYHAVGLIYDLANGRTTVTEARAELAEITLRHV
ncbi:hypothetical protein [Streptomyces silvensis]|uniref:hypothetical protein n=1 Tax=Streptomyces silvensis TaxID=1765722 RepID=UPI0007C73C00|nr:hypothetical protein [Streptomyces silvensis]